MADNAPPPPEAIEAQQAFDRADAEVHRLVEQLPSGVAVAAGEASIPDDLRAQVDEARQERMRLLKALLAVKRWPDDGGPHAAEAALRKAARGGAAPYAG